MMIGASLLSLFINGVQNPDKIVAMDLEHLETIFGNCVFVFIMHHSVSGIIYPVRPQKRVYPMLLTSFILGGGLLILEGVLASFAFGGVVNTDCHTFPCSVQELYNENFLAIPFVGAFCNFYPFTNVAAVPILTITLRNNIFEVMKIPSRNSNTKMKKGLWSIALSAPVIIVSLFFRNP